jgi:hypothetical protein
MRPAPGNLASNHSARQPLSLMEHRDVEYSVVQLISSTRWKWTVQLKSGGGRTGVAASRLLAIRHAERVIDEARIPSATKRQPKQ